MSGIKQTYHIGCENVGQRIPNVSSWKVYNITTHKFIDIYQKNRFVQCYDIEYIKHIYQNYLCAIETGMNWYFLQWYVLGHTVEPIKLIYECMGCDTLGVGALTWDYVHWF